MVTSVTGGDHVSAGADALVVLGGAVDVALRDGSSGDVKCGTCRGCVSFSWRGPDRTIGMAAAKLALKRVLP